MNTLIKDAIANSNYELHYQPKLDVKSGDVVGVECLARLKLCNGDVLYPNEFIDTVYRMGMNASLFKCLLNQSIIDVLLLENSLSISINLKYSDILTNDVAKEIKEACNKYLFPYDKVTIELSEKDKRLNNSIFISKINEIKLMGSKISIDDFGIEHSNLDKFLDFYIDEVKFDRSILNSNYSIVRKLVMLLVATFNSHGIYTVAEGVEDNNTLLMVQNMNFQCVQGFVFSQPMNINKLREYCSNRLLVCQ